MSLPHYPATYFATKCSFCDGKPIYRVGKKVYCAKHKVAAFTHRKEGIALGEKFFGVLRPWNPAEKKKHHELSKTKGFRLAVLRERNAILRATHEAESKEAD